MNLNFVYETKESKPRSSSSQSNYEYKNGINIPKLYLKYLFGLGCNYSIDSMDSIPDTKKTHNATDIVFYLYTKLYTNHQIS